MTAAKPASPMLWCGVVSYVMLLSGCVIILVRVAAGLSNIFDSFVHPSGELERKSQFFRLSGPVGNPSLKILD